MARMSADQVRLRVALRLLGELYADVTADFDKGTFVVKCEKAEGKDVICEVGIIFEEDGSGCKIRVQCEDEAQGICIRNCLRQLADATMPISI